MLLGNKNYKHKNADHFHQVPFNGKGTTTKVLYEESNHEMRQNKRLLAQQYKALLDEQVLDKMKVNKTANQYLMPSNDFIYPPPKPKPVR